MIKALLIAVSVSMLGGCAVGAYIGEPAQVYANPDDAATLTVMRKSQFLSAAVTLMVELDGNPIARLKAGDLLSLPIAPGTRFIKITASPARTTILKKFRADPGGHYYFRLTADYSANAFSLEAFTTRRDPAAVKQGYNEIHVP